MRNIRKIFLTDLKNICSHFFAFVIAVGLCALPALYAWFNIYANWDPYANTGNIKIAVASLDRGYTDEKGNYSNMGSSIEDELRESTSIGWVFLDTEEEAIEGIHSGAYYAAVVIEPDFTESMLTALSDNFQNPRIRYYENEKINAVATKITDTAVDTLRKSINQQFIEVVTERVFRATNEISTEIKEKSVFDRFEEKLKEISGKLANYESMISSFLSGNAMLKTAISKASGSMDSSREKVGTENGYMAQASKDMASTRSSLNAFNGNVQATMNAISASIAQISIDIDTSGLGNDAASIDGQMNKIVSDTADIINQASSLKNALNQMLVKDTEEKIKAKPTEEELQKVYDKAFEEAKARLIEEGKSEEVAEAEARVAAVAAREAYKKIHSVGLSDETISQINDAMKTLENINNHVTTVKTQALEAINVTAAQTTAAQASVDAKKVLATCAATVENIKSLYNNTLVPQMTTMMNSMQQILDNVNQLIGSLDNALGDMDTVFAGILSTVDSTNVSLEKTREIMGDVRVRLNKAIDRLETVSEDERAAELVRLLGGDPEVYGSFFSEPVVVHTNEIYPVSNYGSAVTPFYTTLAIWVGGIFLTALFKVKADPEGLTDPKPWELFLGRYQIFFFLGQIQALIIVIGDLAIFHVQCLHPVLFWLASAVTSFVFSLLIYSLTISFGDIGKALTVVMVVIQIAGSSGTFPIELLPAFYRSVYVFFPFPYAINAMRECIGGLYEATYGVCLAELLIFAAAALFIGLVVRLPLMGLNHFIEERMEDTKMM